MTITLLIAGGILGGLASESTQVRADETVVLFPSLGRPAKAGGGWDVEVRGWIFEPEADSLARAALVAIARAAVGVPHEPREKQRFEARLRPFLVDNERGKVLKIRLCGKIRELGESEPNGHFHGTIALTDEEVRRELESGEKARGAGPARLKIEAVLPEGDARSFQGTVLLIPDGGVSVISDVDDTVKVSEALDKKELLRNTFLREFRAVPGMAELYSVWARKGISFHYVTASPWQLYEPLSEFLRASGFPAGTFHMKLFRIKDASLVDMFSSPVEYKRSQIEPLLEAFPNRKFVLVGDSGEMDPEIYGALARKHVDSILAILIRDVTGEGSSSMRMRKAFEGVPAPLWQVFRDPKDLSDAETIPVVKSR